MRCTCLNLADEGVFVGPIVEAVAVAYGYAEPAPIEGELITEADVFELLAEKEPKDV